MCRAVKEFFVYQLHFIIRRSDIHLEYMLHITVTRETSCIVKSLTTSFIHYVLKYSFCNTKSPSPLGGQMRGRSWCSDAFTHLT